MPGIRGADSMSELPKQGLRGMAAVEGSRRSLSAIAEQLHWIDYDPVEDVSEEKDECVADGDTLYVPRGFARSSLGAYKVSCLYDLEYGWEIQTPFFPELREYQEDPVEAATQALLSYHDVILKAYTGSGKTVMATSVAAQLGVTTLIIVDQNKLARQWEETLINHFGYKKERIGRIQGPQDKWDYEDKDFTIAMVQSIYDKELDDDLLEYFGMLIVDEYHSVGAEQYSNVFQMFPTAYRLSVSATDRNDSRKKVVRWHLCAQEVALDKQHQKSTVRVIEYKGPPPSYYSQLSKKDGRYISELVEDGDRNLFIAEHIVKLYEAGRTLLVIGARIHHLECLHALCRMLGIPYEDMLMYTGSTNSWRYVKDKNPARTPSGWEDGTEFTPIKKELKLKKTKLHELDAFLNITPIIFSTYSAFSKGVDVPELDTGIDVTPKATFVQIHGRILRLYSGKKKPIWVTIRDYNSFRAEYQLSGRLKEFSKSNVEVVKWHRHKGLADQKIDELRQATLRRSERIKDARIITGEDGRNLLLAPPTGSTSTANRSAGTGRVRKKQKQPNSQRDLF